MIVFGPEEVGKPMRIFILMNMVGLKRTQVPNDCGWTGVFMSPMIMFGPD